MPTTPVYSFPYPALTDAPNGAAQIQALAEAVETRIQSLNSTVTTNVATLANPARAQLRTATGTSCLTGTFTALAFDTEDFDSANGHNTVTNNSRYTCQSAGVYLLAGGTGFTSGVTNNKFIKWQVNGVDVNAGTETSALPSGNTQNYAARVIMVTLAVSDFVQLFAQQFSGSTQTSVAASTYMSVLQIRNNAL